MLVIAQWPVITVLNAGYFQPFLHSVFFCALSNNYKIRIDLYSKCKCKQKTRQKQWKPRETIRQLSRFRVLWSLLALFIHNYYFMIGLAAGGGIYDSALEIVFDVWFYGLLLLMDLYYLSRPFRLALGLCNQFLWIWIGCWWIVRCSKI